MLTVFLSAFSKSRDEFLDDNLGVLGVMDCRRADDLMRQLLDGLEHVEA